MEESTSKILGNPYGTSDRVELENKLANMDKTKLIEFSNSIGIYSNQAFSEYEMRQAIVEKFKRDERAVDWSKAPKPHVWNFDPNDPKTQALKRMGFLQ